MNTLFEESIVSFTGEYRFLSNFWLCKINVFNEQFPSVENAYVASKLNPNEDNYLETLSKISNMTPAKAKAYGRKISLRPDWDQLKLKIMQKLVSEKFKQKDLLDKLKATGDALLIEGNYWNDKYWGQCPVGVGNNYLGKILMNIRDKNDFN